MVKTFIMESDVVEKEPTAVVRDSIKNFVCRSRFKIVRARKNESSVIFNGGVK